MSYYIETNTLRALARSIRCAEREALSDSYTSFLTVFEILSGTTDENFAIRRAILSDLLGSFLRIDWRSPITIISESFDVVGVEDSMTLSLQRVADLYAQSSTWDDAKDMCRDQGLSIVVDTLLEADTILTIGNKAEQEVKGRQFRHDVGKKDRQLLKEVIIDSDEKEYSRIKDNFLFKNYTWLLIDAAATVVAFLPGENHIAKVIKLLRTYNRSINYYLKASAITQARNLLAGTQPGDNDFYDVSHFLYVNKDTIMVSDDKLVQRVCSEMCPSQIMSESEFATMKGW